MVHILYRDRPPRLTNFTPQTEIEAWGYRLVCIQVWSSYTFDEGQSKRERERLCF